MKGNTWKPILNVIYVHHCRCLSCSNVLSSGFEDYQACCRDCHDLRRDISAQIQHQTDIRFAALKGLDGFCSDVVQLGVCLWLYPW